MKNTTPVTLESLVEALRPHVEWTEHYEPENDVSPKDQLDDAESVQWVRDQVEAGSEWAWFQARIVASFAGLEGSDSLGACSYESEKAWKEPGGYYCDMRETALRELAAKILPIATLVVEIMKPAPRKVPLDRWNLED